MAIQMKVEKPKPIARDMSLEHKNRQQPIDSPEMEGC